MGVAGVGVVSPGAGKLAMSLKMLEAVELGASRTPMSGSFMALCLFVFDVVNKIGFVHVKEAEHVDVRR